MKYPSCTPYCKVPGEDIDCDRNIVWLWPSRDNDYY